MGSTQLLVGPAVVTDGAMPTQRAGRTGETVVAQAHGRYQEAASRGGIYTMTLNATTTGVSAGNIVAAAAAAVTQFALWNPLASGKNLVLLKFGLGIISGTPGPGPVFHGIYTGGVPSLAANGTIRNNLINGAGSVATGYAIAAGAALTGGTIGPIVHSMTHVTSTATAQATTGMVDTNEWLDGSIVLPPGTGWAPLWSAAGTTLLNAYSVVWEEVLV